MSWPFSMVALIPARAGSQRIKHKNTKPLAGHPLIAYTIAAAQQSGVFRDVLVCSDDPTVHAIAADMGASVVGRNHVGHDQADIIWVRHALALDRPEAFAILRPTSPFRTADTIRRAFAQFTLPDQTADSIRAVEPVKQHPYKMWTLATRLGPLVPLFPGSHPDGTPYHSSPTQSLPAIYIQNSSLEMSWTSNVEVHGTISGKKIAPFFTEGYEGFSIDYPEDWDRAEQLIASSRMLLVSHASSPDDGAVGPPQRPQ